MRATVKCPACEQGVLGTYAPEYITRPVERDEGGKYHESVDYDYACTPNKGAIFECFPASREWDFEADKYLVAPHCGAVWHGPYAESWEPDEPPPLTRIEPGTEIQALFGDLLKRQVPEWEKGPSATEASVRRDGRVVVHVNRYEPGCSDEDADLAAVALNRDKERL